MRKIVLFSDGTGNSSGKANKTNVWRMFEALNQTNACQLAKYDDGVGTSPIKLLAVIGGAFGWGLKRNVLDLYKFVCRTYPNPLDAIAEKDRPDIYGFGFSRGSFTIRVLVDFIANEGLVTYRSEKELSHNAAAAYRHYRSRNFLSWSPFVIVMRRLRDALLWSRDWITGYTTYKKVAEQTEAAGQAKIPIKFLGLWDTVEAYGMPIAELKRGIDLWIWPMVFGDKSLSHLVERACHALSLDDERMTFHPLLWDEEEEAQLIAQNRNSEAPQVTPGRLTQVWFAGVHSNVGGGYPDDQLSLVSLEWMMQEAMYHGLDLDKNAVMQVSAAKSPYSRLYDSRAGAGVFYRYEPRSVDMRVADSLANRPAQKDFVRSRLCRLLGAPSTHTPMDNEKNEILPIIDSSVITRMAFGSDQYAPFNLPRAFWVMTPNGELIGMNGPSTGIKCKPKRDQTKGAVASAALNYANQRNAKQVAAETMTLHEAAKQLTQTDDDAIGLVWDTVWWRRAFYFLTVLLTTILATYPWLADTYSRPIILTSLNFDDQIHRIDQISRSFVGTVVNAVGGLIPSYFSSWTEALIDHPIEFASIVAGIAFCLTVSQRLQSNIRDKARLAWHGALKPQYLTWWLARDTGDRNRAALAFAISLCVLAVVAALSAYRSDRNLITCLEVGVITLFLGLLLAWRTVGLQRFKTTAAASIGTGEDLPLKGPLRFARRLRGNQTLRKLSKWVVWALTPPIFALIVVAASLVIANRVAFDVASSAGAYCRKTPNGDGLGHNKIDDVAHFSTDNLCAPTGLFLQAGRRYRITIDASSADWFDKGVRTDIGGFSADSLKHLLASPLKRWWRENWFQPIARIGALGNDEYVLSPKEPLDPVDYPRCTTSYPKGEERASAKISDKAAAELIACASVPSNRLKLVADITAKTTGELFVYVNDAVLAWPGEADYFYRNNRGTASVSVSRADE